MAVIKKSCFSKKTSINSKMLLKRVSTPLTKINRVKILSFNISTTKQVLKSEKHPIIGFENPKTWYEKLIISLNLHRIPQVVLNRQVHLIYNTCEEQLSKYKHFYIDVCGLPDNFQTWFSVTQLHLWLVMVRIRKESNGRDTNQYLVNRFFNGVEHKIRDYGIKSERIVVKTVKEMIENFRGSNLSYDEGMCKSDLVLAAALWRNFFTTCDGSIKEKQIAYLVRYVRAQLKHLDQVDSKFIYNGIVEFLPPEQKL